MDTASFGMTVTTADKASLEALSC